MAWETGTHLYICEELNFKHLSATSPQILETHPERERNVWWQNDLRTEENRNHKVITADKFHKSLHKNI